MKILTKEVKNCEDTAGKTTCVLDITYSHYGKKGRILVRDYNEDNYDSILKQLRKEVRKALVK